MMRAVAVITLTAASVLLSGASFRQEKDVQSQQMTSAACEVVSGVSGERSQWVSAASEKAEYLLSVEVGAI